MMTTRFPRIRETVEGIGHVQVATKAKTEREHQRRVVTWRELVDDSQIEVIKALLAGEISWAELVDARRRGELKGAQILTSIAIDQDLVKAIRATLPKMGKAKATRSRYTTTLAAVERSIAADPELWSAGDAAVRVRGLANVQWQQLHEQWRTTRSAADWNHVARLISTFLTVYLANKRHAFALEVRGLIPRDVEEERVPDLTPALFWRILEHAAEHVRPAFMTLLLLGCRVRQEYLKIDRAKQLMPERLAVRFPGTGTNKSKKGRVVTVDEEYWPWVDAGVPSPLGYKWLRMQWIRACVAAGAGTFVDEEEELGYVGLHMHDLRHALAQWASDAGVPLDRISDVLGHSNVMTTSRYTRVTSSNQVARAAGDALRRSR